jgi:hypothetical protein
MHYSIQHDLARDRLADIYKETERARLATIAREGDDRPGSRRFSGLFSRLHRQRARRPAPAT